MDGETFLHVAVASDKRGGEVITERVGTAGSYRLTDTHTHTGHTDTDAHPCTSIYKASCVCVWWAYLADG